MRALYFWIYCNFSVFIWRTEDWTEANKLRQTRWFRFYWHFIWRSSEKKLLIITDGGCDVQTHALNYFYYKYGTKEKRLIKIQSTHHYLLRSLQIIGNFLSISIENRFSQYNFSLRHRTADTYRFHFTKRYSFTPKLFFAYEMEKQFQGENFIFLTR